MKDELKAFDLSMHSRDTIEPIDEATIKYTEHICQSYFKHLLDLQVEMLREQLNK